MTRGTRRKILNVACQGLVLIAWAGLIVFLLTADLIYGETFAVGETVPLVFEIFDLTTGQTISGESPTAGLYRSSDGFWLDWSDDTFKDSGWVLKDAPMAELDTEGRYLKSWDSDGQNAGNLVAVMSNGGPNFSEGTSSITLVASAVCPPLGTGNIPIDQDYPNPGDQRAEDPYGAALPGVYIRVYSRANYDAGRVEAQWVEGLTYSDVNGDWEDYIYLDPGDYTTSFYKRGYQVVTFEFTVTP